MFENFVFDLGWEAEQLFRVLFAIVLGFSIGVERKMRYKETGMRTHAIVAAGASLIMIVSKYGFSDIAHYDASRVAAQIVSGVGFLGAGIIMYRRDSLRGVTTAAGIWATAGIGMAVGAGQYILAAGATGLIVALQCVLHAKVSFFQTKRFYIFRIKFLCIDDENEKIKALFGVQTYSRINYYNVGSGVNASAEISTNRAISDDDLKKIIVENKFIISIERVYHLEGKE